MQFTFRLPTKIIFGQDCVVNNSKEMFKLGAKALIVTGGSSSKRNGSLKDVTDALNNEGISFKVFNEIEQNPSVATVIRGGETAREMKADFIIGIGGGSPLDAAKAVAVIATNNLSPQELMSNKRDKPALPVVAVPTTSGTGSEVTPYSILTVDWAETKMSISGDDLFPVVALMDARYTLELPWDITANTAVDALSHSIEGFINKKATVFSDMLAIESIAIIGQVLKNINPDNITLDEREELLYASMLGGVVIAQARTGVVHALGYPLTYYKDLPHGLANGIIMKAAMEFLAEESPEKVEVVLEAMDLTSIDEFGELMIKVLPKVDLKLTQQEQQLFITKTLQAGNIANCPKKPLEKDINRMLVSSNLT